MLGCVLGFGGYREEALDRLRQAMRASPHDPLTSLWLLWIGLLQFFARQFAAAVETLPQGARLRPEDVALRMEGVRLAAGDSNG